MPAAGVHPVQRWRGELGAEFGWLPGDQGAVAAAGAADVDDGPVRLAYHAVPGFGDAVTVEVQPDDGEVLALLHLYVPKTLSTSCHQAVLVDQASGVGLPSDAVPVEIDRYG